MIPLDLRSNILSRFSYTPMSRTVIFDITLKEFGDRFNRDTKEDYLGVRILLDDF